MAIPRKEDILPELVVFLSARPGHRAHCTFVYDELVKFFPRVTDAEQFDDYENSRSKWANRVQYARLLGVEDGLIHRARSGPEPSHGVWILTEEGIRSSLHLKSTTTVGAELAIAEKEDAARKDLRANEMENELVEGAKHKRLVSYYERRPALRAAAVRIHGTVCNACTFDFGRYYGPHGKHFIEVHHLKAVSKLGKNVVVNAETDMTVLCANCHRMVHRDPKNPLTIHNLKKIIQKHG